MSDTRTVLANAIPYDWSCERHAIGQNDNAIVAWLIQDRKQRNLAHVYETARGWTLRRPCLDNAGIPRHDWPWQAFSSQLLDDIAAKLADYAKRVAPTPQPA